MRWILFSVLFSLSAQAASVLVVPADDNARAVTTDFGDAFAAAKLTVKTAPPGSPAVQCLTKGDERVACLAGISEKAKVVGVFVVSGGLKGAKGAITLELIVNGAVAKKDTVKLAKGKVKQQVKGPLAQLIKLLPKGDGPSAPVEAAKVTVTTREPDPPPTKAEPEPQPTKVEPKPEPVVAKNDAPVKTEPKLTPQRRDDELELRSPSPASGKLKVGALVATGATVIAAGTAATFIGLGMASKGTLEAAPNGISALNYDQALALQKQSNDQLSVGLGVGIGAGVAAIVTAVLWGIE